MKMPAEQTDSSSATYGSRHWWRAKADTWNGLSKFEQHKLGHVRSLKKPDRSWSLIGLFAMYVRRISGGLRQSCNSVMPWKVRIMYV
eukprot:SAG31_NODE_30_length_32545_cov_9.378999_16_plen_87_part_00